LTFVIRRGEVLLIRKKRGLGAGKINGPGGRQEKGEKIADCAVREVEEEVHITPIDPQPRGELRFQFLDGYSIHVHVFTATEYRGEVCETDEAIPFWTKIDAIPYAEMWADDILWLPRVLAGETVSGYFLFDGDTMLDQRLG
jgi:8-oxo-dGTP diphosphatase